MLKVGHYIFNPQAIAYVNLESIGMSGEPVAYMSFVNGHEVSFDLDSAEGKAIAQYFSHPNQAQNLLPDTSEEEEYGWYKERGGTVSFTEFADKRKQHLRLLEIEEPNTSQMRQIQQLEHELLY